MNRVPLPQSTKPQAPRLIDCELIADESIAGSHQSSMLLLARLLGDARRFKAFGREMRNRWRSDFIAMALVYEMRAALQVRR